MFNLIIKAWKTPGTWLAERWWLLPCSTSTDQSLMKSGGLHVQTSTCNKLFSWKHSVVGQLTLLECCNRWTEGDEPFLGEWQRRRGPFPVGKSSLDVQGSGQRAHKSGQRRGHKYDTVVGICYRREQISYHWQFLEVSVTHPHPHCDF